MLRRTHSLVPVTALAFVKIAGRTILLAGQGTTLKALSYDDGTILLEAHAFSHHQIHGIIPEKDDIEATGLLGLIIYGGPFIQRLVINIETWEIFSCAGNRLVPSGWVLHGAADPCQSTKGLAGSRARAALVSSQNALLLLHWRSRVSGLQLQELSAGSNSILYSAHVKWESQDRLLLATGTAFGEVSVRSYVVEAGSLLSTSLVLRVPGAHEGSIFGVHLSDPLPSKIDGQASMLLASCSDDRTIRVWAVRSPPDAQDRQSERRKEMPSTTSTGFGDEALRAFQGDHTSNLVAMAWAHGSRIWGVQFTAHDRYDGHDLGIGLVSYGEDASCHLWHMSSTPEKHASLGTSTQYSLKQRGPVSLHAGKNIWSIALACFDQGSTLIATGGADGMIAYFLSNGRPMRRKRHSLSQSSSKPSTNDNQWHGGYRLVDQQPSPSPIASSGSREENDQAIQDLKVIKSYKSIGNKQLLAVSEQGKLFLGSFRANGEDDGTTVIAGKDEHGRPFVHQQSLSWCGVARLDGLKVYSIAAASPRCPIICFAAADSAVYCLDLRQGKCTLLEKGPSKTSGLLCHYASGILDVVVSYLRSDAVSHWRVYVQGPADGAVRHVSTAMYPKILPHQFVVTSMAVIESEKLLILGARNSVVALYNLSTGSATSRETPKAATEVYRGVHQDDAVTSITVLFKPAHTALSDVLILTTGRNGSYAVHQLIRQKPGENASGQITLATIHVSFPMFASVLEGAFLDASGYLVLYGFRGKHFVAWNETNQREILAVDCGGAHRTWDFAPASDAANGGCLIWTQASKIHRYSQSDITYRIAQNGTHGREINALAYWPIFAAVPGSGLRLLATGAEDTTIRIAVIRNEVDGLRASETGPFDHLAVLKKHTTGIQALQWSCCGKYLFSSGGSEEFFVWRVRQIPMLGLGVVWEARCHRQDEVCDARITNFDARPVLSLGCQPAGRFLISMAYSDSTVRLFLYDCTLRAFDSVFVEACGSGCITHASLLTLAEQIHLCTAGSDGCLTVRNVGPHLAGKGISVENAEICLQESRPSCEGPPASVERKKIKIHQSSILCAKSIQIGAESLLFVSGGEDNAVGLAWIHRDGDVPGKISSATLLIPKAHACAVTSIAVVPSHPSIEPSANGRRRHLMATSGPDQRLKVWSITLDPEDPDMSNVDVTLEHEEHSSVADASAADSYVEGSSRKIAICGVGIETWALDTSL